jgi:phosphopentomutase
MSTENTLIEQLIIENKQLRDVLYYWREECTGYEPSISVFERKVDEALSLLNDFSVLDVK